MKEGEGVGQWLEDMLFRGHLRYDRKGGRIATGGFDDENRAFIVKENGSLLSLGNSFHGHEEHAVTTPTAVATLQGKRVVQVSAGMQHSLVLTDSGDVYSFGNGYYGRLGHGNEEQRKLPKLVEALKGRRVVEIACDETSLVMTESGDVLEFGRAVRDNKLNILVPDSVAVAPVIGPMVVERVVGFY